MGRKKKLLWGKYQISDRPAQLEAPGIEVKLGWDTSSNESVTVKAFDLAKFDDQDGVRELVRFEMNTLWRLDHPNVVRLVDVFTSPARNKTVVVVEAVSGGGDLFDTIAAKGRLEDDLARNYFSQLLDAVNHCHARGVCHRDIKPENVLLDARGSVKLTGFALAGLFDPSLGFSHVENLLHATCGTPDYTAPEVIQGLAYEGTAADVWSLGVTLYAMLAGYLPFEAESLPVVFDKAQAGDFMTAPGMSAEARSLLDCMLEPDPESRYTMQDVRAHPWLASRAHKRQQEQEQEHRCNPQHHHHPQQEAESNLRWNGRSPRPAVAGGRPVPAINDGDCGGGTQDWSLDSFVRRQDRRQQEGAEHGPAGGQMGPDWCEQQHKTSGFNREESTTPGGRGVSCSSSTPSSSRHECSPFHDCPSPSECEEEEEEGEGEGVRERVGLDCAEELAPSISGGSVAASAAGAAAHCFSRSVSGSEASCSSGTISVARRLGATRLVLSLRPLNSDAATAAEADTETVTGDDDVDGLLPAEALQSALKSLGCVCRLMRPTENRSDERKTRRVKVKACRAIAADGGRVGGGERGAEDDEADSIVGVLFSVMLPAEAPAPPGVVASAVGGGDSMHRRDGSSGSGGSSASCTNSTRSTETRSNLRPETTNFLAVLSTGTVDAFNALIDDLLAVPARLCGKNAEGRRERRQSRSRPGRRTLGVSGGGMGGGTKGASGLDRHQAAATVATATAPAGT